MSTEKQEKKQKQASAFVSSTYVKFSTAPFAKASHMTKPRVSVRGRYDVMNTERHEKLDQHLLKLDRFVYIL